MSTPLPPSRPGEATSAAVPASAQSKHAPRSATPTREERTLAARAAVEASAERFVVRRPLDQRGWGTAIGAGIVSGLVTAYLTAIWTARAPLHPPSAGGPTRPGRDDGPRRDG